jgi:hypothetical protein
MVMGDSTLIQLYCKDRYPRLGSRPKIGEPDGEAGERRRGKHFSISGAGDQVIVVYDQFIGLEGLLIGIYEPVMRHVVLGIELGLGHAVCAVSRR